MFETSEETFLNVNTHEPQSIFLTPSLKPERIFFDSGPVRAATYKRRVGWVKGLKAGLSDLNHPLRRARAASDLRRTRPAAEILREISTCRGLVAGRFHAMCLSLLADTPFAAMQSNTLKTKGLLADAGLVHRLAEDPVEALRLAPTWSDGERELAARFVSRARADASAMFREIASLAR